MLTEETMMGIMGTLMRHIVIGKVRTGIFESHLLPLSVVFRFSCLHIIEAVENFSFT